MKTLIKVLFISLSLVTVYLHYLNNISSQIQQDLYKDIGTGNFRESSTARFNVLDLDYPNISLTALPMKGLVARYLYLGARYEEALELLNASKNDNPFIMYNESLKQDIYYKLGVQDSVVYYAEKAFTGLPNNQKHFIDLARAYSSYKDDKNYYKIDSIFKKVENTDVYQIWKFYFASVLTNESLISDYAKEKALYVLENFEDVADEQLYLSAKYTINGKENIDKSLSLEKEGIQLFVEERYREAALIFEQAYSFDNTEYLHLENAAICNFKFGYYDRALPQLNSVIDAHSPKTGQSEFILAKIYFENKEFDNACEFIRKSAAYEFRESYRYIGEYCSSTN